MFDSQFVLVGDTDTLDLDPRSFSQRLDVVELERLDDENNKEISSKKIIKKKKLFY